jgi:alpha-D-ribose 1-methylphosphonate 5-triphosphate synthase subunit PhnH
MSIDLPGFADPVLSAQSTFRAILDAMSRPGTIFLAGQGLSPPAPLMPASAACLLTLVDAETTLSLDAGCAAARDWIAFHCGAPAAPVEAADFVLALALPDLTALGAGSDDGPQDGATVILQVASLRSGQRLTLSGPGLRAPATLDVLGLPDDFVSVWAINHARFPRGIDLILCAGDELLALPRSLRITRAIKEA